MTTSTTVMKITIQKAISEIHKLIPLGDAIYLAGSPGVGKTSAARQVAADLSLPYHEVRVAEFEPVDFRGGMYLDVDQQLAVYFNSEIWPTEKCVLCLDEITQGHDELWSAILKLVRERQIGKFKLHPETVIIATGNYVSDKAGCKRMGSAVRESFIALNIESDLTGWLKWYANDPDHNDVVEQYVRQNPELLHNFDPKVDENQPSPRNWWKAGRILNVTKSEEIMAGVLGSAVAPNFMAFARTHVVIPTVAQVIDGEEAAPTDLLMQSAWADQLKEAAFDATLNDEDVAGLVMDLDDEYAVMVLQYVRNTKVAKLRTKAWKPVMLKHAAAITAAMRSN